MGKGFIFLEEFGGVGMREAVLDEVALFSCRGKYKVDSFFGAGQLIDSFSKLSVAVDICSNSPVIDFFGTIGKGLEVGPISSE